MRALGRLMRLAQFDFAFAQFCDVTVRHQPLAVRQRYPADLQMASVTVDLPKAHTGAEKSRHLGVDKGLDLAGRNIVAIVHHAPADRVAHGVNVVEHILGEVVEFAGGWVDVQQTAIGIEESYAVRQIVENLAQALALLFQRVARRPQLHFVPQRFGHVDMNHQPLAVRQRFPIRSEPLASWQLPGAGKRLAGAERLGARLDVFFNRRVGAFHPAVFEMPAIRVSQVVELTERLVGKFGRGGGRGVEQDQVQVGLADHDAVGDIVDDRLQQSALAHQRLIAGFLLLTQAGAFHRHRRLIGEGGDQIDLPLGERPRRGAANADHRDGVAVAQQGHGERGGRPRGALADGLKWHSVQSGRPDGGIGSGPDFARALGLGLVQTPSGGEPPLVVPPAI